MRVLVGRTVESRSNDFTADAATHVGHFFRALVHEQHHEVDLGVVGLNRLGDLLHDRRLTGLGRRHDEATLTLTNRGQQVHDARGQVVLAVERLELELLVREEWRQVLKTRTELRDFGVEAGDGVDAQQGGVLFV